MPVYIVFSTFNLLITFYFIKIFFIYFLLIRSQKITSMRIYSNEVPQITKTCTPFAQAAKFMSVKLPPFSAGLHKSGTALTQKAGCLSPDSQPFFVCFTRANPYPVNLYFQFPIKLSIFPDQILQQCFRQYPQQVHHVGRIF